MNILNHLFFAVAISSITSTLLLIEWRLFCRYFMVANPKMINVTLRIVCVTYLLPIGYMAIFLTQYRWLQGWGTTWKLYFAGTRYINWVISILIAIWLIIAVSQIRIRFLQYKEWCRKLEDNIPIEGELASEVFSKVCKELGILEGKVSLQRNPLMESPLITRVCHPQVILPEMEYSAEELEMIFYHELSHYKLCDLKWKVAVIVITLIQCFNPFVYPLLSNISFWGECATDVFALKASGNLYHARQYFEKIESMMPDSSGKKDNGLYALFCINDNNTLAGRVEFVRCYQQARKCNKKAMVAFVAFLFTAVLFAFEVGVCISDIHKYFYQLTENDYEIQVSSDGMHECYEDNKGLDLQQEFILPETNRVIKNDKNFYKTEWEIGADSIKATNSFSAKVGQRVDVNAGVQFFGEDYKIGIMDENGHIRYVQAVGSISHNFIVTETGKYCVFVKNNCTDNEIFKISVSFKLIDANL